ncbi:hypothetical protein V6N11_033884 [Hibiscus sabdariffa]|uniref:Methyltransferase domain-containing protein n=1 Tax=Hibiscus sabdariffa TaxID=183260 RepID=A0ABR2S0W0_9ROSI
MIAPNINASTCFIGHLHGYSLNGTNVIASLNRAEIQGCDLSPFVDLRYSQYLQKNYRCVIRATTSSTCMLVGNHVDTLQGKVWAPTHIISTISDDMCEEPCDDGDVEQPKSIEQDLELGSAGYGSSLVLAGLHACGDLSVTMLKTLLECDEVRAVNSIGCCYHLLSEEGFENGRIQYGFPMSCSVRSVNFSLGKSSHDLAC